MAKKRNTKPPPTSKPVLLQWTRRVPSDDSIQDPLGLTLRVSARLAAELLYCITSVTPRARYYSFLPWCVLDYRKREAHSPKARPLTKAVRHRETALTIGCVLHHKGELYPRGGLVGSRGARRRHNDFVNSRIDVSKCSFTKGDAFRTYLKSLVNLGFFVSHEQFDFADDESHEEIQSIEDLELSDLGVEVARTYDSTVGSLGAVKGMASPTSPIASRLLARWGERGGLCELAVDEARDNHLLRDIFFDCRYFPFQNEYVRSAHHRRRHSLMLFLELVRQLDAADVVLEEFVFADAVYHGAIEIEDGRRLTFEWPAPLGDVANRWRMFYSHYYLSVALESLFAWTVATVRKAGLTGVSFNDLFGKLLTDYSDTSWRDDLGGSPVKRLHVLTPKSLLALGGVRIGHIPLDSASDFDAKVGPWCVLAERGLESVLRDKEIIGTPEAIPLALVLLTVTLARYSHWYGKDHSNWVWNWSKDRHSRDSPPDLSPPVLIHDLQRHFEDWWETPTAKLVPFIMSRYIVRQHCSLAYEKSKGPTASMFHVDGDRIRGNGSYGKIGVGNPRYRSAVCVLQDLGLIVRDDDTGTMSLTEDGLSYLTRELTSEAKQ